MPADYPPEYDHDERDNSIVEAAFADYSGPGQMYRSVYKYTACGPTVGFCIEYIEVLPPDGFDDYPHEVARSKWVYCDDLYTLGTWSDMARQGQLILAISVSSIVEGVDQTTDTHEVSCHPDDLADEETPEDGGDLHRTLHRLFFEALTRVDDEADAIWQDTHGCETCAAHWGNAGPYGPLEGCDGVTPVWKDCPDCEGHGAAF